MEAYGHKIIDTRKDGRSRRKTSESIDARSSAVRPSHMVSRAWSISHPTEYGTVYTLTSSKRSANLPPTAASALLDGPGWGTALSPSSDVTWRTGPALQRVLHRRDKGRDPFGGRGLPDRI